MMQVDTSARLTIFPKPIDWKMLLGSGVIAGLSFAVVPFAWADGAQSIAWMSGGLGASMALMLVLLIRKRARGNPDPSLMLGPEGLHLMTGTTGVIPWAEVNGLGSYAFRGNKALVININKDALAMLEQGKFFKKARKFDAALGVHALLFFQQQVEVPLHDLADMLHDYSIAHGGPPLQPNRTP